MSGRPLRIGYFTPEYPTQAYTGGIGSYVRQTAQSMVDFGHSACVLLWGRPWGERLWDGPVLVYGVGKPGLAPELPKQMGKSASLVLARRLSKSARSLNLDLIEVPEWGGATAFLGPVKPRGLAVVVRLHTCSAISRLANNTKPSTFRKRLDFMLEDWLESRAISTADAVTAVSRVTVDLTRKLLRIPRDDFYVIPNPVGSLFWKTIREDRSLPNPSVLFVGRLEWRKGADLLVRAIPAILDQHPTARLILAGSDTGTGPGGCSMLSYLNSLLPDELRSQVSFLGHVEPTRLAGLYHQATVCVFPSRWEAFGIVCAEAMASGVPVIVSDAEGFRELVEDGETGLVAKGEDSKALAAEIIRLLSDTSLGARLARAAHAIALERFEAGTVAKSMLRVYRGALRNSRLGRGTQKETT